MKPGFRVVCELESVLNSLCPEKTEYELIHLSGEKLQILKTDPKGKYYVFQGDYLGCARFLNAQISVLLARDYNLDPDTCQDCGKHPCTCGAHKSFFLDEE